MAGIKNRLNKQFLLRNKSKIDRAQIIFFSDVKSINFIEIDNHGNDNLCLQSFVGSQHFTSTPFTEHA